MTVDPALLQSAAGSVPRRLFAYSGGFLFEKRLRRILQLCGHQICVGWPGSGDGVVVWGQNSTARRGQFVARTRNIPLLHVEDAFLRSMRPGRLGDPPLALLIDPMGVHYNAATPSVIEHFVSSPVLHDSHILDRADAGIARIHQLDLSKYNIHQSSLPVPDPGYVLVVDQTRGDASLAASGADQATFDIMLTCAVTDHPAKRIVIKSHLETSLGIRPGHYGPAAAQGNVTILTGAVSPRKLLANAAAVYTVSSHLGFEAIFAGHRPHVFGTPFYAGWGLTQDAIPIPRRAKTLTPTQLFAAAMILAPTYYDPCRDRLCSLEDVLNQLEAETRAYRQDRHGHVAFGMRAWKRRHLQQFFGNEQPLRFAKVPQKATDLAQATGAGLLFWAGKEPPVQTPAATLRVEDGFLRSRGLGAKLIPPLSLVTDDSGIYYDPTRPSRLEALIAGPVPPGGLQRVERLIHSILKGGITKYNTGSRALPYLPYGHRILVPGQVEDDASVLKGAGLIRTNLALLQATRAANPKSVIIYKPHPDVEAGLRPGAVSEAMLKTYANVILQDIDAGAILPLCDDLWTMTSAIGFEALLRGKPVTCLGVPFYAGWGLTTDLHPIPKRRQTFLATAHAHGPMTLARLAHAALIAYPRYFDPVSRRACPPEVAIDRLIHGPAPRLGVAHRNLGKLQGRFSGYAYLWR